MKQFLKYFLLFLLFSNCHFNTEPNRQINANDAFVKSMILDTTLFAYITLNKNVVSDESQLQLKVNIINGSKTNALLPAENVLKNPILMLLILNEKNDTMHTIPPSVPTLDTIIQSAKTLSRAEKYEFQYDGLNLFSPPLSKGKYKIRMLSIPSNEVSFEIK